MRCRRRSGRPACGARRAGSCAASLQPFAFPVHVVARAAVGAVAVEHAGEHEHQVREAVEVLARGGAQVFGFADGHDGAFGAARHGAAHVRLRGGARAGGQDEFIMPGREKI